MLNTTRKLSARAMAVVAVGGVVGLSSAAIADDDEPTRPDPVSRMMKLDKDGNGAISKEELPERLQSMFARMDADGNGELSKPEIEKGLRDRVAQAGGPRGDRGGDRGGRAEGGDRPERGRFGRGPGQDGPPEGMRDRFPGGPQEGRGRGFGERGPEGREGGPPQTALMMAIDKDKDGKISATELRNAVAALQSLDKNEDGILDQDELRPPRSEGGDRPERGRFGRGPGQDGPPEGMRGRFGQGPPEGGPPEGRSRGGFAEMTPEARVAALMERMDKNEDGKLTDDEIPERMKAFLDRLDENKDGALDKKELSAMGERMRGMQGRGGARGRGPGGPPEGDAGGRRPKRPSDDDVSL